MSSAPAGAASGAVAAPSSGAVEGAPQPGPSPSAPDAPSGAQQLDSSESDEHSIGPSSQPSSAPAPSHSTILPPRPAAQRRAGATARTAATPGSSGGSGGGLLAVALSVTLTVAAGAALWWLRRGRGGASTMHPQPAAKAPATAKGPSPTKRPATRKGTAKQAAQHQRQHQQQQQEQQQPQPQPEPVLEPIPPDMLEVVVSSLQVSPPSGSSPVPLPLAGLTFVASEDVDVEGAPTTFGVPAWSSLPPATAPLGPGQSAPSVRSALAAGAACVGKAAVLQPALDPVGESFGSPCNKARVAGGGATGAAVQVSRRAASFALAADATGEARVPAACCGVFAWRPSPGVLGGPSVAGAGGGGAKVAPFSCVSVLTADAGMALRVAQALGAPGPSSIKGEILQFVVAQDLFDLCAPELQPAILALKKAILKWAGSDQAGAVQLLRFLASHVHSWSSLLPGRPLAAGFDAPASCGVANVHLPEFLEAAVVAARVLRADELHQRAGATAAAAAAARAEPAAADAAPVAVAVVGGGVGADGGGVPTAAGAAPAAAAAGGGQGGVVPASGAGGNGPTLDAATPLQAAAGAESGGEVGAGDTIAEQGTSPVGGDGGGTAEAQAAGDGAVGETAAERDGVLPPQPSEAQLAAARTLAADVCECLRTTVKADTLMVLPALPYPPPKRTSSRAEFGVFAKLTEGFNAVAALGGCPSLTAPVGVLRDGSPVAISILAVHRFDKRLLAVTQHLCPMIAESFQQVKEEITQMALRKEEEGAAGPPATRPPAPSSNGHGVSNGRQAAAAAAAAVTPAAAAHAISNGKAAGRVASTAADGGLPPVDPKKLERAEKAKARGNELYQAGKYLEAMNEYTKAIGFNPSTHVYYSNRAMACIKLFRFEQAEDDCNKVLKFELSDKDKVKALLRRATARDALQRYEGAEADLRMVLKLEPNNKQAREDLRALRQHQAQMAEAQAAMVAQIRAQQRTAGASDPDVDAAAAASAAGLPPGFDPSMFPPGFLEGQGLEELQEYLQAAQGGGALNGLNL